jgi:hypothetical protein
LIPLLPAFVYLLFTTITDLPRALRRRRFAPLFACRLRFTRILFGRRRPLFIAHVFILHPSSFILCRLLPACHAWEHGQVTPGNSKSLGKSALGTLVRLFLPPAARTILPSPFFILPPSSRLAAISVD